MLRVKTLGGWQLVGDDGTPRAIPGQRIALLAVLVAAGDRGIARDRAAALLWPDSSDDNARHSLGQSVYALRRDASSPDVITGTTTLLLNPDVVACDAWELETAARDARHVDVVDRYTGPFLDGIRLRGSAELEQLIDIERRRLATTFAKSVESLARAAARKGDALTATTWWRRLAAAEPLSSRVALELVKCLAEVGDRSAALQAARVHEVLVSSELDAAPDPAFVSFVNGLRRDDASESVPATAAGDSTTRSDVGRRAIPVEVAPATDAPNAAPPKPRLTVNRRLAWGAFAAAASVAVLVGARQVVRTSGSLDPKRVYVAPLENRTGDGQLDQIGGMASDWVSQGLEQSGLITVATASRAEDAPARRLTADSGRDAASAAGRAAQLGAGTLVSGAYYRVAARLRFHVQITDVTRGEVLDAFDTVGDTAIDPSATLEAVRQRALGSLASVVDPRLGSWIRVASKPPSFEAYREFVSGQSIWGSDHRQALGHFLRAAQLDSTFYAARVEAAILHRLLGECARTEAIARELDVVRERLAPYDYHVLDGQVAQCNGDWEGAYRQARAVSDLRPNSAFLEYSLALQAMQLGRFGEAKQLLGHHALAQGVAEVGPNYAIVSAQVASATGDRVRGLDIARWIRLRYPTYARAWVIEAVLLSRTGRVEDTERFIDTMAVQPLEPVSVIVSGLRRVAAAVALTGDTAASRRTLTRALAMVDADERTRPNRKRSDRAQLLYELGRLEESRALLTELVVEDSTDVDVRGHLGLIAARCGDAGGVAAIDTSLAASRPPYSFARTLYRARMAALLGERDRALGLLASGLNEAGRFLLPGIRESAEFSSIRQDRRFEQLTTLD